MKKLMIKKEEICNCIQCPDFQEYGISIRCNATGRILKQKEIQLLGIFPKDCPLENIEE